MKFVLNAYNLKIGGGLNVAFNFIEQLKNYPDDVFYVFAPENCGYEKLGAANIMIIFVPTIYQNYLLRYFVEHFWMKKRILKIKPDVVFSMGNFALPIHIKQGLLFHYPYLIYEPSAAFGLSTSTKWTVFFQRHAFRSRLKYADRIFPQTKVAAQRLKQFYGNDLVLIPIPNAYSMLPSVPDESKTSFLNLPNSSKYLLCLSKYYTHKNIEILLEVAKILKENKSDIRFITTVGADQHTKAQKFIDNISELQLEDYIINIGPVNVYDIPALYNETDGLILPTLLESFTATYVDAMYLRKPIYTSDLDFAREICGDVAYYFDPNDPVNISHVVTSSFQSPDEMNERVEKGSLRSATFPNWKQVADMYVTELKKI